MEGQGECDAAKWLAIVSPGAGPSLRFIRTLDDALHNPAYALFK